MALVKVYYISCKNPPHAIGTNVPYLNILLRMSIAPESK